MQTLTENTQLIPHLDIDPNDFRKGKKTTWHKVKRKDRVDYWRKSLAQAGITELSVIIPGKLALRDAHHEIVYRKVLSNHWHTLAKYGDSVKNILFKIDGGLTLIQGDDIIFGAQCCSDLNNFDGWENAATVEHHKWQMLWNGHPWTNSMWHKDNVLFTEMSEDKEPSSLNDAIYSINRKHFRKITQQAREEVESFGKILFAYWQEHKNDL